MSVLSCDMERSVFETLSLLVWILTFTNEALPILGERPPNCFCLAGFCSNADLCQVRRPTLIPTCCCKVLRVHFNDRAAFVTAWQVARLLSSSSCFAKAVVSDTAADANPQPSKKEALSAE